MPEPVFWVMVALLSVLGCIWAWAAWEALRYG